MMSLDTIHRWKSSGSKRFVLCFAAWLVASSLVAASGAFAAFSHKCGCTCTGACCAAATPGDAGCCCQDCHGSVAGEAPQGEAIQCSASWPGTRVHSDRDCHCRAAEPLTSAAAIVSQVNTQTGEPVALPQWVDFHQTATTRGLQPQRSSFFPRGQPGRVSSRAPPVFACRPAGTGVRLSSAVTCGCPA